MTTARRSLNTPPGYNNQPGGRVNLYSQTYIGFVKSVEDSTHMGRIKVWIPELHPMIEGADQENDVTKWISVSYCSPFAGATPPDTATKGGTTSKDSQQSYGWWAVPPHIGNEVVVMFINGDPSRGIWMGCLYQQRMNHMVPGLASSDSFQEGSEGANPPTVEYNKRDPEQARADNPMRPRFEPLHEGLQAQGLYTDSQRGTSTTSARRSLSANTAEDGRSTNYVEASHAYGFVTPRGNTIHVDDNPENEFIRMRTRSGAQVLINETVGYIYMISKNGNSWFEISDEGINAFTTRTFNVRAMQGTNLHSEGNTTINSVGSTNMTGNTGSFRVTGDLDLLVPGSFRVTTAGGIHLNSQGDLNLTAAGNASLSASGTVALQSGGNLGVTSSGTLFLNGGKIMSNGGAGPAATKAEEASAPRPSDLGDREVNQAANYPESSTKSIVGVLPTHEPWEGHPTSETPPDTIGINGASGSGVDYQGPDEDPEEDSDVADPPPAPADGKGWLIPVSGRVGSQYGWRNHPTKGGRRMHHGVDISKNNRDPVYATKAGKVVWARSNGGAGKMVKIQHADGFSSTYMHLSSISVKEKDTIAQGTVVGRVGSTGESTGPHLHFEIHKGSSKLNPKAYIPELGNRGSTLRGGTKSRGS